LKIIRSGFGLTICGLPVGCGGGGLSPWRGGASAGDFEQDGSASSALKALGASLQPHPVWPADNISQLKPGIDFR
jgi:hypothetical protein